MTFKEFNQIFISLNKPFLFGVFIYDQKAVSITKTHFLYLYTVYIYSISMTWDLNVNKQWGVCTTPFQDIIYDFRENYVIFQNHAILL